MRRHDLDWFSLVAGALFLVIATAHLMDATSSVDLSGRWVVPIVLIGLGVVGLAGALRGRETADATHTETADRPGTAAAADADLDDAAPR